MNDAEWWMLNDEYDEWWMLNAECWMMNMMSMMNDDNDEYDEWWMMMMMNACWMICMMMDDK